MPDIAAISGLLSSLKASTDITKAMLGLRDANLVRDKAVELTTEIMSAQASAMAAQAAQAELTERVRDLEKQITTLENWNQEKDRYELTEVAAGVLAYSTRPGMENGEPPHKICSNCYQHCRKSLLQPEIRNPGRVRMLICQSCNAELIVTDMRDMEHMKPSRTRV
ncbi:MAG: hypothetical protein PGN25_15075 [Methylorubrum populi]